MALIKLRIIKPDPADVKPIIGAPAEVTFIGAATLPDNSAKLYYRWYASSVVRLSSDNKILGYSMHENAFENASMEYKHKLGLGSHVITFAVSDQQDEKQQDFDNIRNAAVTGGRLGDSACVIHVYAARIVGLSSAISKTNLKLSAEAPAEWDAKYLDVETNQYIFPYQEINQLAYHWKLEPLGDPPGRSTHDSGSLDHGDQLTFSLKDDIHPIVTYQPDLSSTLENDFEGPYRITLSVLRKGTTVPIDFDEVEVVLVP